MSSDGGLVLLREIEAQMGLCSRLAACLVDPRDPSRILHSLRDMIASRVMAIAAGYEDCDDLDVLRQDPALKLAIDHDPVEGLGLPSQPTLSRLENLTAHTELGWRSLARMGLGLIDVFCNSYGQAPKTITLDIDDTAHITHGGQQLSLFNGHIGERCLQPIHVYEADSGKPVTCLLFPGHRPKGDFVARMVRHLVRRIEQSWPHVTITIRGDSHYASHQAMDWLEAQGHSYIFGLASNKPLRTLAYSWTDAVATERALVGEAKTRAFYSTAYQAGSWSQPRHVVARVEVKGQVDKTRCAVDVRFVVTNIQGLSDQALYEEVYCARGQAENWIKDHKRYTASNRSSCHKWQANQFRLFIHTAAYWLLHRLRTHLVAGSRYKQATFETLRRTFIKVGVRVTELKTRIKLSFPQACPVQHELEQLCKTLAAGP